LVYLAVHEKITDILVQKALEGAKAQGAETKIFYLNELKIRGCQACGSCKKTGECSIHDDMTEIFREINEADAIIIGSPVYFGRFTAQLAPVLDRLFAYLKSDFTSSLDANKKFSLVFTQGQPNVDLYLNTINGVAQSLSRIGFEAGPKPLVGAGLGDVGATLKNENYLQTAFTIGKDLVNH
jgi:multimeric flavodoxin WrbA